MAEISRYGAYLPKYRAPLGDVQKFFGRPGRPRSRTLSIPALDEDERLFSVRTALASHLKERVQRYPFKPVWRPAQTAAR